MLLANTGEVSMALSTVLIAIVAALLSVHLRTGGSGFNVPIFNTLEAARRDGLQTSFGGDQ
ncbi:hypothetical protein GWE18_39310 [Bradyrhizobium sp. CSA112]|uniref:hypothetical protein n=1 Tax=Bradyrhizobium sp. CSA112 TaxID=2699170 RepID=UPI0023B09F07|nr:hypothetical protein [Bradyrhizobium sp. CSA112]MDE5458699.1 hypothetical protein [Bradyrhizobium sp. CSA112]